MERAVQHQRDSNDRIMAAYVREPYSRNTIRRMVFARFGAHPLYFSFCSRPHTRLHKLTYARRGYKNVAA